MPLRTGRETVSSREIVWCVHRYAVVRDRDHLHAYGVRMAPLMLGIAAIGWSRVALRDHTPAQTVVGTLLGGLAAAVVFSLMR